MQGHIAHCRHALASGALVHEVRATQLSHYGEQPGGWDPPASLAFRLDLIATLTPYARKHGLEQTVMTLLNGQEYLVDLPYANLLAAWRQALGAAATTELTMAEALRTTSATNGMPTTAAM